MDIFQSFSRCFIRKLHISNFRVEKVVRAEYFNFNLTDVSLGVRLELSLFSLLPNREAAKKYFIKWSLLLIL